MNALLHIKIICSPVMLYLKIVSFVFSDLIIVYIQDISPTVFWDSCCEIT